MLTINSTHNLTDIILPHMPVLYVYKGNIVLLYYGLLKNT